MCLGYASCLGIIGYLCLGRLISASQEKSKARALTRDSLRLIGNQGGEDVSTECRLIALVSPSAPVPYQSDSGNIRVHAAEEYGMERKAA